MSDFEHEPASAHNFSVAFEQLCNVVAISDTRDAAETLQQLVLQCFTALPEESSAGATGIVTVLLDLFGLRVTSRQVQRCLDRLVADGSIYRDAAGRLTLAEELRAWLQSRIDTAAELDAVVRQEWLGQLREEEITLAHETAWKALKRYLARAFSRHGILTTALLEPSVDATGESARSLTSIADSVAREHFGVDDIESAKHAFALFHNSVARYPNRARYISQLANSAFSYFSLAVAPNVSARLRENLHELTLFLDTNFLFGILGLHVHPQVEISNELIRDIREYNLPFKMRFHEATEVEMRRTIAYYGNRLRSQQWTPGLSRAALRHCPDLSGLELRYHAVNAESGISVETFLRSYQHIDALLRDRDISIYRQSAERGAQRSALDEAYRQSLKSRRGKSKAEASIEHDVTLLYAVRSLRTNAASSLQAGALLLTCDYTLCHFDWRDGRHQGRICAVLPHMMWQLLRPFVPAGPDFDLYFAEAFALPEFRTLEVDSPRAEARNRLLYMLASFKNVTERTAAELLSNELLIDKLESATEDAQVREQVELAMADEYETLMEDHAALAQQLEELRHERDLSQTLHRQDLAELQARVQELEQVAADAEKQREEFQQIRADLREVSSRFDNERRERAASESSAQVQQRSLERAIRDREIAISRSKREVESVRADAERQVQRYRLLIGAVGAVLFVCLFEAGIRILSWSWILNHPSSAALQVAFDADIVLLAGIWAVRKWRAIVVPLLIGFVLSSILILGR